MPLFRRRKPSTPAAGANLDQQIVFHLSKSRIPSPKQLKYVRKFLSPFERLALYGCLALMAGGAIFAGTLFYRSHIELVAEAGGRYTEGVIGNPQYINPLYASLNDADADLERLIFSRLFTVDAEGRTIPDLAAAVELSQDEKVYTVKLKTARWQTGDPVTADDVLFTFNLIQNADYKSPLRERFLGVTARTIDAETISFTLREPFSRFTSLLDFGILPNALWEAVSPETMPLAEFNLKPIGSGKYIFKSLVKNRTGTIRSYTLERNPDYYGTSPYLDEITFRFFPSGAEMIAALNNGQINGMNALPLELEESIVAKNALDYHELEMPQITGVFFNLKAGLLADAKIRRALRAGLDQAAITEQTAGRAGEAALSFLPSYLPGARQQTTYNLDEARRLLDEAGWTIRTVSAEEAAANAQADLGRLGAGDWRMKDNKGLILKLTAAEEMRAVAEAVRDAWGQIGVKAELDIRSDEAVRSQAIANRQFEVVVYTEALPAGDPYPFWHSTGAGNLTGYNRSDVDTWLEEARLSADQAAVTERYGKFQEALLNDAPVAPLYWHTYAYPRNKKIKGFTTTTIDERADRLNQVEEWYVDTKRQLKRS